MARILIIEDEHAIAEGILLNLKKKQHQTDWADEGCSGLSMAQNGDYDLIILDIRLPNKDGFEICQTLRSQNIHTPILMLTARIQAQDKIHGLESGADDYLTKPFDLDELLARVEALIRRQGWNEDNQGDNHDEPLNKLLLGKLWIDFQSHEALTLQGRRVLGKKEIAVMELFAKKPNQVISREELLKEVWKLPSHPNTRVVDNVIVALRKLFEQDSQNPRYIINVRGIGYKFLPTPLEQ